MSTSSKILFALFIIHFLQLLILGLVTLVAAVPVFNEKTMSKRYKWGFIGPYIGYLGDSCGYELAWGSTDAPLRVDCETAKNQFWPGAEGNFMTTAAGTCVVFVYLFAWSH